MSDFDRLLEFLGIEMDDETKKEILTNQLEFGFNWDEDGSYHGWWTL